MSKVKVGHKVKDKVQGRTQGKGRKVRGQAWELQGLQMGTKAKDTRQYRPRTSY